MSASGLDKEDDVRKISTFLYRIGDEAEDILVSTNNTDGEIQFLLSGVKKHEIRESEVQPARSTRGRISRGIYQRTML